MKIKNVVEQIKSEYPKLFENPNFENLLVKILKKYGAKNRIIGFKSGKHFGQEKAMLYPCDWNKFRRQILNKMLDAEY